jgi:hypothetical protein
MSIVKIVDHDCISKIIVAGRYAIPVKVWSAHILPWQKIPSVVRNSAKGSISPNTITQRRPSVVTIIFAPAYPCTCPLISGYPHPAITRVIFPSAIVERCPSPFKIRHPRPSIVSVIPVTIGSVGPESRIFVNPYLPKTGVKCPSAIRTKVLLKNGKIYINRLCL